MSDSIFEIEHHPGGETVLRFKSPHIHGLSDSTKKHMLVACKEMLLAMRGMLDVAIERTEETGKAKQRKKTKIEVQ